MEILAVIFFLGEKLLEGLEQFIPILLPGLGFLVCVGIIIFHPEIMDHK